MRDIKFRAWDKRKEAIREVTELVFDGKFYNVRIIEPKEGFPRNWALRLFSEVEIMQFTGLKDKTGKEIYEGDLLRVAFLYGEEKEQFEAIYAVESCSYDGIRLQIKKLISNEETYSHITLVWKRDLCLDYYNRNYTSLAIEDSHGENRLQRSSWRERWFSNDIEILGNIHQHPELIKS